MKIIGLTGGIACGKSMISKHLSNKGYPVIDADIAARKIVEIGTPALQEIIEFFGKEILLDDGNLNRKKLGEMIFTDELKRKKLNEITHPRIREWMLEILAFEKQKEADVVFMDIPLLFENKSFQVTEKALVVYVDKETQISRLMKRDKLSKEQALFRIKSQIPMEEKKARADYIIDNRGTEEESVRQLDEILRQIKSE
jgi:dephospho-CoA kinase